MVKPSKLYAHLLESTHRTISFRDFERLLEAFGFIHDRTVGSHRQYVHARVPFALPVQPDRKDAKRYQVRQFLGIVREYELSIEE
ncbi:MAG TPA: type II toxin-antitoxin system HicA family toxin [Allosphingosinicella sp.]|jgi:predicted RNA binding protein YcfA (HicA-like mRNA interferase family)